MENQPEVNPLQSEHLAKGVSPIIACVGSFEDFSDEFSVLERGAQNVNWYASEEEAEKKNFLHSGGEYSYVVSSLDNKNKYSYGFSNCTGIIVAGKEKETGEDISFLSHQFFGRISDHKKPTLLPAFIADINKRLTEAKERCVSQTIDAVIFGGTYFKDIIYKKDYQEAIQTISENIKNMLGFEPVVITGPKTNAEELKEDILYNTKNRRLYIQRPEVGDISTESYLPSNIANQEKKWKPKA